MRLDEQETRELWYDSEYDLADLHLDEQGRLFRDGELLTMTYSVFVEYQEERDPAWRELEAHRFQPFPRVTRAAYLGEDEDGNDYWDVHDWFVIEKFEYDGSLTSTLPAVHPSGDVYFLQSLSSGHTLSRIERRW